MTFFSRALAFRFWFSDKTETSSPPARVERGTDVSLYRDR
jgi:hypothetical protein